MPTKEDIENGTSTSPINPGKDPVLTKDTALPTSKEAIVKSNITPPAGNVTSEPVYGWKPEGGAPEPSVHTNPFVSSPPGHQVHHVKLPNAMEIKRT